LGEGLRSDSSIMVPASEGEGCDITHWTIPLNLIVRHRPCRSRPAWAPRDGVGRGPHSDGIDRRGASERLEDFGPTDYGGGAVTLKNAEDPPRKGGSGARGPDTRTVARSRPSRGLPSRSVAEFRPHAI
jgi:hypothetical protein